MQLTLVRNATMMLKFGETRVLVDPMLGAKGSLDPFPSATGNDSRNPLVDLPMPVSDLVEPDVVVVTHTHPDHWDDAAAALLPRDVPILAQHEEDAAIIARHGFTDVRVLREALTVAGVEFVRTEGKHGSDELLAAMPFLGQVMGVVLRHPGDPTLYIAGDTIVNEHVREAIAQHEPDVVVLNTGEAVPVADDPIIMGPRDVVEVARLAPEAQIIAVHLEALNHCPATRAEVRAEAQAHGIGDRVLVPADGESMEL